jgi:dienelactone hydrolase
VTAPLREKVVRFGPGQSLAGILSTTRETRADAPHVVFVNAGIIHRVGPNRLYVDLARRLVSLGFPTLRFDLSGLGDSEVVAAGTSLTESALADIRAAFDYLETARKATSFIICGLCSGANHSMLATFADERAVGTLLIDPTVTRTRKSRLVHLGRRLRHAATWASVLTLRHPMWARSLGRFRRLQAERAGAAAQAAKDQSVHHEPYDEHVPSEEMVRVSLQRTIDRGVHFMFVFTGGVNHVYNYREQLFDLLPGVDFRGQLRLEYMPETDHTVSDTPSRAALLDRVADWATRTAPVAPAPQLEAV